MIDTLVMSLGSLCLLALNYFEFTFYRRQVPDVPPDPKDLPANRMEEIYLFKERLVNII